jgi:gliding motility-associated-like protein
VRQLKLFFLFCFCILSSSLFATHNRAGEITYRKISNLFYEVKIVTYTKSSSPADRPELEFFWGDGTSDTIPRQSITPNVGPDIQKNIYVGTHTYPGSGSYTMYFLDENRNSDVVNMPGSVNIAFYVETKLVISPAIANNSSPSLLQPPIDNGAVGQIFLHNPNAFDPDGDSLSYELVKCKGLGGQVIPTFSYPAANNSFTLDSITGDLIWDSPLTIGEYNVAMIIREWRNLPGIGTFNIGYVTRDMQITIYPPVNQPPIIATVNDTCVEAGTVLNFVVNVGEPNNELITLTASGGPFVTANNPATFTSTPAVGINNGVFNWNTDCSHVRKSKYTVVFKAVDNNTNVQLVDLETMFITVVGPSPKNPYATPLGNSLVLNWDTSLCSQAIGYKIYRRQGSFGFTPSQCETGVPAYTGYNYIGQTNGLSNTTFTDDNNGVGLAPAVQYCYMVIAIYPDGAESYASIEFCGTLIRDLPIITNVDVNTTSNNSGEIYVAWGKPTNLDFTQTPGPFKYVLQRKSGSGAFTDVVSKTDLNDTTFTDAGLNTLDSNYTYRVAFSNETPGNTFLIGNTQQATSMYLRVTPSDEKNTLNWSVNVPWNNSSYEIYREVSPGNFNLIGNSASNSYIDDSLTNGVEYCYYVKSFGNYLDTGLVNPIINKSQIGCAIPLDNVAPCAPTITLKGNCLNLTDTINWNYDATCGSDIEKVNLYFKGARENSYALIATENGLTGSYIYNNLVSIAGCYYLTAIDTAGNISLSSDTLCIDPCPTYELPNVFTPNSDNINDLYHPIFPYRDVQDITFKVFNRWGALMFETTDIDINWNGKKNNNGEEAPAGVYFFICTVYETSANGELLPRNINGTIELIR